MSSDVQNPRLNLPKHGEAMSGLIERYADRGQDKPVSKERRYRVNFAINIMGK